MYSLTPHHCSVNFKCIIGKYSLFLYTQENLFGIGEASLCHLRLPDQSTKQEGSKCQPLWSCQTSWCEALPLPLLTVLSICQSQIGYHQQPVCSSLRHVFPLPIRILQQRRGAALFEKWIFKLRATRRHQLLQTKQTFEDRNGGCPFGVRIVREFPCWNNSLLFDSSRSYRGLLTSQQNSRSTGPVNVASTNPSTINAAVKYCYLLQNLHCNLPNCTTVKLFLFVF